MKKEKKFWRDFGEGNNLLDTLSQSTGKHLIIFDTETTGLDHTKDTIIQISAIKMQLEENNEMTELARLDMYINPQCKLPKKIVEITGITDELLADKPVEDNAWPTIREFFDSTNLLCGHNAASFDIGMLKALYDRHNEPYKDWIVFDTMRMAQELYLKDIVGNFKLGNLAANFDLDFGLTFHNSMDDVIATTRLLRYFIEEYIDKREKTNNTPKTVPTQIKSCWAWTGYRGMQRLYVRVAYENRVIWMNQRRPYNWGEKDVGSLAVLDMKDIEKQVLKLYKCETLEQLSKVRDSRYAAMV